MATAFALALPQGIHAADNTLRSGSATTAPVSASGGRLPAQQPRASLRKPPGVAKSRRRQVARKVPVVVFIGESNSGGYALNSKASAPELETRPALQIWDNIGNRTFAALDIGSNNLLGHVGLEYASTTAHGWELGLANSVEAGLWETETVYLLKAGQGGSKLRDWERGQTYWRTFVTRSDALRALLFSEGMTPVFFIWASIGINDAVSLTPQREFITLLANWLEDIRNQLGSTAPILLTELPEQYPDYNNFLQSVASRLPSTYIIDTSGAEMRDPNHWSYAGMRQIAADMVSRSLAWYFEQARSEATNGTTGF